MVLWTSESLKVTRSFEMLRLHPLMQNHYCPPSNANEKPQEVSVHSINGVTTQINKHEQETNEKTCILWVRFPL